MYTVFLLVPGLRTAGRVFGCGNASVSGFGVAGGSGRVFGLGTASVSGFGVAGGLDFFAKNFILNGGTSFGIHGNGCFDTFFMLVFALC